MLRNGCEMFVFYGFSGVLRRVFAMSPNHKKGLYLPAHVSEFETNKNQFLQHFFTFRCAGFPFYLNLTWIFNVFVPVIQGTEILVLIRKKTKILTHNKCTKNMKITCYFQVSTSQNCHLTMICNAIFLFLWNS